MQRPRSWGGFPEWAGTLLLTAWLAWSIIAACLAGSALGLLSPYVLAPLALAAGIVVGTLLSRADRKVVRGTAVALAVVLLFGVGVSPGAAAAPLGYANANAALAVQLLGLCGLALIDTRGRGRLLLALTAVGLCGAMVLTASRAGFAVCVPLVVLIGWVAGRPPRRSSWVLAAALVAVVAIVGVALGVVALARTPRWPRWAVSFLDETRQRLWHDAFALWSAHVIRGGGPGSFARSTPLAVDPDTAAAHSAILQVGAETGLIGAALLGAIIVGGILWAAQGRAAYAIVGIGAWAALVVHSFVDHLVDFPPLVLVAGTVLGLARASGASEELNVTQGEDPLRG